MLKVINKILTAIITIVIILAVVILLANLYVVKTGERQLTSAEQTEKAPYILVFGASVNGKNVSHALSQRLDTVYELYSKGKGEKIIVSGDHSTEDYNEVQAMNEYLVKKGVPKDKIIMDHEGIDTFVSVSRLKEKAPDEKFIFVTQREHLIRALYFAEKLDVDAVGVPCENYSGGEIFHQRKREFLARMKAFVLCELMDNDIDKFNKVLKLVFDENFD